MSKSKSREEQRKGSRSSWFWFLKQPELKNSVEKTENEGVVLSVRGNEYHCSAINWSALAKAHLFVLFALKVSKNCEWECVNQMGLIHC